MTATELSEKFQALSVQERIELCQRATQDIPKNEEPEKEFEPDLTPMRVGCSKFPLARAVLPTSVELANTLNGHWCDSGNRTVVGIGETILEPSGASAGYTCETEWGFGNCEAKMSPEQKQRYLRIDRLFKNMVYVRTDDRIGGIAEHLAPLPLYFLEYDTDATVMTVLASTLRGQLLFLVASSWTPLVSVFHTTEVHFEDDLLAPIKLPFTADSMTDNTNLSNEVHELCAANRFRICSIEYSLLTLDTISILSMRDCTADLSLVKRGTKKDLSEAPSALVAAMMGGRTDLRRHRQGDHAARGGHAAQGGGRHRGRGRGAGASRRVRRRLDGGGRHNGDGGGGGDSDDSDESGSEHGGDGHVGDDLPPAAHAEWRDVVEEHDLDRLPSMHYSFDTRQVRIGDATGEIVGSIRLLREHAPNPQVAFYCRRHGCSFLKRCTSAPSHAQQLEWFAKGLSLPAGKVHSARHLAMMDSFR